MSYAVCDLMRMLERSVSAYHTVSEAEAFLRDNGFSALHLGGAFPVETGGRYYVSCGTSLAAFTVGEKPAVLRIAAAHTDSPCLRVKSSPESVAGGCCRLNIEPYGGMIQNTWLDRPLSLAGAVMLYTDDPMKPERRLVKWDEPLLTIPNLAIHINREVNKGVALKANIDLLPICRTVEESWEKDGYFLKTLASKLGVSAEEIASFELTVYCAEKPALVGFAQDMLSSPRLDNITSVHACLNALVQANGAGLNVAVLYDNEEIGSNTRRGADSSFLSVLLEKIALALGMRREEMLDACVSGMFLSCDAAHAVHPNHPELADPSCAPYLNRGVALKRSASYSSEAETCAIVAALCKKNAIPLQIYRNRADQPGGGTVGSMATALLAMPGADIGVPILAMHSARELMGVKDQEALCRLCEAFFAEGAHE